MVSRAYTAQLENLVLEYPDDPSSIKLIDFGLAAFLTSRRMGMQCGSPGFVGQSSMLYATIFGAIYSSVVFFTA